MSETGGISAKTAQQALSKAMNDANITKYGILILCFIMIIMIIVWAYGKSTLNKSNCTNMNSLYKDFGMVHTINTSNTDYSYNLRDYYIMTAYNACCSGQFKNDFVNVCALKNVIKQGARCLDFEVYSLNNTPVIATSSVDDYSVKETYNSVLFSDALNIIKDYAFSGSTCPNPGDPLIIHLRIMSTNQNIYTDMANLIEQTLSDYTLGPKYSYENNGKNLGIQPLSEFMGKVVIMVDRSNPLFESTGLDEYVNMASNSIFMRCVRYSDGVKYTPDIDELIDFNKKNMTLVLPDLSATNSNSSAQLGWTCGCQLVAMCFQNFDTNMEVYSALFAKNGSAFVLKPEALRYVPVTIPAPKPANPAYSYEQRNSSTNYYSLSI
jgi:hypothetical protein